MREPSPTGATRGLAPLLRDVHASLDTLTFPLDVPGSQDARRRTAAARAQLTDYVLPRLAHLDAPLVAVVGGSTGAGKSTLVNGLVGRRVAVTGAVRPTTRQPLLLHNPADDAWFEDSRILPTLSRVRLADEGPAAAPPTLGADSAPNTLLLRPTTALPAGLALLDAPDIDSIADENRRLAGQLLAAADLWLFVTTANRYADAVPWALLEEAGRRDVLVGVVLDRVPPGVEEEIRDDLLTLLAARNLGHAPIFVIPETPLGDAMMLPEEAVAPISRWLQALAADAEGRRDIARRTVRGAMRALADGLDEIAEAVAREQSAADALRTAVDTAYQDAHAGIMGATADGTLLRGEVLARWQDFVGTGEFMRSIESRIGTARDRIGAFFTGRPAPAATVAEAIGSGLQTVVVEQAATADETVRRRWRSERAGVALLEGVPRWQAERVADEVSREIRAWQQDLLELVQAEAGDKRFTARMLSFGVNGVAVALMVVVFASTGGLTGGEIGIAGASAIAGQKLLEAIFGDDAVRRLAARAKENLERRIGLLLDREREPFDTRLEAVTPRTSAEVLRVLAVQLRSALPVTDPSGGIARPGTAYDDGGIARPGTAYDDGEGSA